MWAILRIGIGRCRAGTVVCGVQLGVHILNLENVPGTHRASRKRQRIDMTRNDKTCWHLRRSAPKGMRIHTATTTEAKARENQSNMIARWRNGSYVQKRKVRYLNGKTGWRWIVFYRKEADRE
jgi:hypothetical protein